MNPKTLLKLTFKRYSKLIKISSKQYKNVTQIYPETLLKITEINTNQSKNNIKTDPKTLLKITNN